MDTLDQQAIDQLLDTADVVHLAVVDPGPYVTALSFVMLDGDMYFRTYGGRRINALRNDPRVAVEISQVDPETGDWVSVIGEGTARIVEDVAMAVNVEAALIHKYAQAYETLVSGPARPPMGESYIVAVTLDTISGRSSGSGWGRRTRPGRM